MATFTSPGSGRWYPGNREQLKSMIENFLSEAKMEPVAQKPIAAISPHAGYVYSGLGNAYSYNPLKNYSYKRVFILGPAHSSYFQGAALLGAEFYQTPLTKSEIDTEIVEKLSQYPLFSINNQPFQSEHSTDNQVPFLQTVLSDSVKLIPIIIGQVSLKESAQIAEILKTYLDQDTFFAISSDFTHYGMNFNFLPFPNDKNVRENLKKLDMGAVERIEKFDPVCFDNYLRQTQATICGANPITVLINMLDSEKYTAKLTKYYCSGDSDQDYSLSVSYVSMVFFQK